MHQNPIKPATRRELRDFGLLMGGLIALFFGLLIPWLWGLAWPLWPWPVAMVLVAAAVLYPPLLGPVHRLWERIGQVLGWVNSRILLGLVFFVAVLPIGLVARLFHDPMARRWEPQATTYRRPSRQPVSHNLERPF